MIGKVALRRAGTGGWGWAGGRSECFLAFLFLLPTLLVLSFLVLYPLVYNLGLGFFYMDLLEPGRGTPFVGLKNYAWLLASSSFRKAFANSLVFTSSAVLLELGIGMGIALLLNAPFRGRALARGTFVLPWAIPTFVAAFAWVWLLDPTYGAFNLMLRSLGLMSVSVPWLSLPSTAPFALVLVLVWKGLPWVVLVLLAGLQLVPRELQEAARVDGATAWRQFWSITVPILRPVITIIVVLRVIWTFNWFDLVYLLTGGGPSQSTLVLPLEVYNTGFVAFNMGRAAAIGTLMFLFLVVVVFAFVRTMGEQEEA